MAHAQRLTSLSTYDTISLDPVFLWLIFKDSVRFVALFFYASLCSSRPQPQCSCDLWSSGFVFSKSVAHFQRFFTQFVALFLCLMGVCDLCSILYYIFHLRLNFLASSFSVAHIQGFVAQCLCLIVFCGSCPKP